MLLHFTLRMQERNVLAPNANIWFGAMFIVGMLSQWLAVYFTMTYHNLPAAENASKLILLLTILTIVILVIKTIRLLGQIEFRKLFVYLILTSLCVVSFIVAVSIYVAN